MVIIYGLIRVLFTVLFLYLIWRRLREDYNQDDLLSYGWQLLLVFLTAGRIGFGIIHWGVWNNDIGGWFSIWSMPGFNYFCAYFGGVVFSALYASKKGWKVWKFAEEMVPQYLVYIFGLMLGEVIMARFGFEVLLWLIALLLTLVASHLIKEKYRSFVWYTSGKKGFVFLFANIFFSILALGITMWMRIDIWQIIFLGSWCLISIVGLVMLGERR